MLEGKGREEEIKIETCGLMPELIDRIPIICPLTDLTSERDLYRILTEPEDAITKEYISCTQPLLLKFTKKSRHMNHRPCTPKCCNPLF